MKINIILPALVIAFTPFLLAAEKGHGHDHGHAHKHHPKITGPNKGRILMSLEPHLEFFITEDRLVKLTFVNDEGKTISPKEQSFTATGGDRNAPTSMKFAIDGDSFISDKPLPEGQRIPFILSIKMSPDAATINERFNIDLAICGECKKQEYACSCDH